MAMAHHRLFASVVIALSLSSCDDKPAEVPLDPKIAASIEVFKNRPIYRELTPTVLASIADDKLEQAVIDYASHKIGDDYEHERQIVASLPPGVRALYITWLVEAEVNNGGFNQYYWNSTGQFSADAVGAFEFFAASKHAALMRDANKIQALEADRMQKFKERGSPDAFSESYKETQLGPLDDRFYGIDEDLSALRVAKVRSSPQLFSGT
jgi:hypothetical protein